MISWPVKDSFHSGHRRCKDKLVGGLGPSKITAVAPNRMVAWAFHLLYFMCAFNFKVEKKQEMEPVNIKETRRQTEKRTKRVNTPVSHNRSGLGVGTSRHPKGEWNWSTLKSSNFYRNGKEQWCSAVKPVRMEKWFSLWKLTWEWECVVW